MRKYIKCCNALLILSMFLSGCSTVNEQTKVDASMPTVETSTVVADNATTVETITEIESSTIEDTLENVEIMEPTTTTDVVEEIVNMPETVTIEEESKEELLNEAQKNSIAMLNYLAVLSQEINSSKNSRMFLEEAYASLINNTNPEKVNELTESHLSSMLDIIEEYRMINIKRDRLQYIYDQNKAMAIKEALPDPLGMLSAASSLDIKRLAASTIYMAVDSVSSYKTYNTELDHEFLQDGWELDDEEAANMHDSRKRAFMFMVEIVREDNLPGELALNESSVDKFVEWKNNSNNYQKIQFLESEESTYAAFGNYWLELASCYYENEEYDKCLEAIKKYEELQADIFRKDYYLAQVMPKAIAAAKEVYAEDEYISEAERYLELLINNTESNEWSLRYFAAEIYIDLYSKTENEEYLSKAYEIALNNVNNLVTEQLEINATYLAEVKEVTIPENVSFKE